MSNLIQLDEVRADRKRLADEHHRHLTRCFTALAALDAEGAFLACVSLEALQRTRPGPSGGAA